MRKLLYLSILSLPLCLALPASATFTLTQVKTNNACTVSPCAVTVTSTGAGHTLAIAVLMSNNQTITSVTGCSTAYTIPAGAVRLGAAGTGWIDWAYCLNASGGTTSVSITFSASPGTTIGVVWELSSTGTISFDVGNGAADTTCTTACALASLSLTGSNDFIAAVSACGGTCSAVSNYTADPASTFPNGDGIAHLINTASAPASNWTQTSGVLNTSSLAFSDAASAGAKAAPAVIY